MTNKIVWNAPDSEDGERRLKQHGFVSKTIKSDFYNDYDGNISLCGNIQLGDGDGNYTRINRIDSEELNHDIVCKKCLKIYNNN